MKALYLLAEQTERQGTSTSDGEALAVFERALALRRNNPAVLLEVARLAAKTGSTEVLKNTVAQLQAQSSSWPDEAKQQMEALETAAAGGNSRAAALQVAFLRNVLLRAPEYRRASQIVKTPAVFVGEPFLRFLKLPSPQVETAPADSKITFTSQPLSGASLNTAFWTRTAWLDDSGKPFVLWVDPKGVHIQDGATLPIPGASNLPSPNNVALGDLNYDFKNDIVIAGPGGVRIYQQDTPQRFTDVTARSRIPAAIVNGSYSGAWPFDVDQDGDLDIVLAVNGGDPLVLRNNGDGTFADRQALCKREGRRRLRFRGHRWRWRSGCCLGRRRRKNDCIHERALR